MSLRLQSVGIKRELNLVCLVEVDKIRDDVSFSIFDRFLPPHLEDHDYASIVQLDLLAVAFVVFAKGVSNSCGGEVFIATDFL